MDTFWVKLGLKGHQHRQTIPAWGLRGICQVETGVDRANWEIDALDIKNQSNPPT
jgi:hypothetical protein